MTWNNTTQTWGSTIRTRSKTPPPKQKYYNKEKQDYVQKEIYEFEKRLRSITPWPKLTRVRDKYAIKF